VIFFSLCPYGEQEAKVGIPGYENKGRRFPAVTDSPLFSPFVIDGITRMPYPSSLLVDVHSFCNAACKTCPYRMLQKSLPMGYMDEHLFRKIVDEFAQIKMVHDVRGHVIFCYMGEPFVDPNVIEKISYVVRAGLILVLQTNAYLLSPEKTDRLIETGFRGEIYVSCHGITPKVYRNVMGMDIGPVLRNVEYLVGRYPRNLVQIRAIPHDWPPGEVLRVKRYWKQKGVRLKMFLPNSRTGLLPDLRGWSWKYPGNRLRGCRKDLPIRDMVIAYNGDVVLCCEDMARKVVLGNVREHSLVEVWNSDRAKEVLEKIYLGKPSEDDFICKTCEFGRSTRARRLIKNLDNNLHRLLKCTY
jgi:radical SAM protein with 4Fe4S-binding SPASM domain